jgi:hypothetical protein
VSSNGLSIGTIIGSGVLCLGVLIGGGVGLDAGFSAYGRYQNIQRAHNKAQVNIINEQNTIEVTKLEEQNQANMIQVTKQKAQIQYQQAVGVRDADQEINKTLTPLYIQYLQIQAMEDMANSGKNNTVIYIPSGQGGIPTITAGSTTGK